MSSVAAIPTLDDATIAWVTEAIGTFRVVSYFAHDHGYSRLWRIISLSESETFYWLKCHAYHGKWAGEVHALTRWTSSLNLDAPRVRAFRAEPLAVLLSEMPGSAANTVELSAKSETRLWHAAGVYLAKLHTISSTWLGAVNPDGSPQGAVHHDPVTFVQSAILSRLEQGITQNLFDISEQTFIQYGATEWTAALKGETPRAVHRDYSPRNWLTDSQGYLSAVIDFEHSRWDVRTADLNRFWDTDFVHKPYLAEAFFGGYAGMMPDDEESTKIQALRLLNAAGGVVWATRVGDIPFAKQNREALHRMMDEHKQRARILGTV